MTRDLLLPAWLEPDAADFVSALLQSDPSARLGAAGVRAAGAPAQGADGGGGGGGLVPPGAYDAIREHPFMRSTPAHAAPSSLRHVCLHAAASAIVAAGRDAPSAEVLHGVYRRRIAALPPRLQVQLAHAVRQRRGHLCVSVRSLWWDWPLQGRFARATADRVYLGDDRCVQCAWWGVHTH